MNTQILSSEEGQVTIFVCSIHPFSIPGLSKSGRGWVHLGQVASYLSVKEAKLFYIFYVQTQKKNLIAKLSVNIVCTTLHTTLTMSFF